MDKKEIYEKIEEIKEIFFKKDHNVTILEFKNDDFENLNFLQGTQNDVKPWFAIKDGELFVISDSGDVLDFMDEYTNLAKENFELKLEKSILKQFPIDFNDVWAVCMDEIKKFIQNNEKSEVKFDNIVKKVKNDYPNLFVNFDEMVKKSKNGRIL